MCLQATHSRRACARRLSVLMWPQRVQWRDLASVRDREQRHTRLDGDAIARLRGIFAKVCADFEAQLAEMDGEHDQMHLLANYPPKVVVFALVNSPKDVSNRLWRTKRPDIASRYYKGMQWSPSYFAPSCGGAPISVVRQYIEQQQTPR